MSSVERLCLHRDGRRRVYPHKHEYQVENDVGYRSAMTTKSLRALAVATVVATTVSTITTAAAQTKPAQTKPAQTKPAQTTPKPAPPKPAAKAVPRAVKPAPKPPQLGITTASGLTYVITSRANGRRPKTGETVLVHYTGTLTDGTKFDSSQDRKEPIAFPLGRSAVIKGWDEGIAQMGIGDSAVLIIPPQLGYGEKGAGGGLIPPNATLVFVVTLVDVKGEALSEVLLKAIDERGIDAAVAEYRSLKARGFGDLYTNEGDVNALGYRLLSRKRVPEAIEILKLNVEAYPNSANVYDSLGEAYFVSGNTALAIQNYEKSLLLDPANTNAAMMLKKLKNQ
jgi:FKBP-type peptidyl-prolyl cis-trans isomerase